MKFQVSYLRPKKKGFSQQIAGDFLKIEDAQFWSEIVKEQGAKNIEILVR